MNPLSNLIKDSKSNKNRSSPRQTNDCGWIEKKLNRAELDFIWYCVNNRTNDNDIQYRLAGNISESYQIEDTQNIFWNSVIHPLIKDYEQVFLQKSEGKLRLQTMWVNYQRQNEFNPLHTHTGFYSFVIWLKIPTRYEDQKKLPHANPSNTKSISNFVFTYTDILGTIRQHVYKMNPELEGTMVLFPSLLNHQVYPFYNCEETRISVSGNVNYCQ